MSPSNMDVVRRLYEAWKRDGFGVVPELMADDIEYVNPPYAVEPGVRHGHDGFAEAARNLHSVYGDYDVTAAEVRELGDRVAVTAHVSTSSKGNAIRIDTERGYLFHVREGRITRFAWFNRPEEAIAELEAGA
jgi:ketosteroid isomerase-like protein